MQPNGSFMPGDPVLHIVRIRLIRRDVQSKTDQFTLRIGQGDAILSQDQKHDRDADAFVPVEESMV